MPLHLACLSVNIAAVSESGECGPAWPLLRWSVFRGHLSGDKDFYEDTGNDGTVGVRVGGVGVEKVTFLKDF